MRVLTWIGMALLAGCAATPARIEPPGDAVADGITLLPGRFVAGEQPDGNSVLLRGREGWIVVDTGRHAGHTTRITTAAQATGLPVAAIVNTHWHLDHVAGNAALREAYPDAPVYASDAIGEAMRGFLADYRAQLQELVARPDAPAESVAAWRAEIARIDAGERLAPTRVVADTPELHIAGRRVRLARERNAVSGGDVWLFDPATRTLVAGDLVTLPVPLFDTACLPGWRASLARLAATDFTLLVPGHGAPLDRDGFATYRKAFDDLLECAAGNAPAAACKAGWLRDAGALVPPADLELAGSLLDYYIPHVLRAPPARRDRYCRKDPPE